MSYIKNCTIVFYNSPLCAGGQAKGILNGSLLLKHSFQKRKKEEKKMKKEKEHMMKRKLNLQRTSLGAMIFGNKRRT